MVKLKKVPYKGKDVASLRKSLKERREEQERIKDLQKPKTKIPTKVTKKVITPEGEIGEEDITGRTMEDVQKEQYDIERKKRGLLFPEEEKEIGERLGRVAEEEKVFEEPVVERILPEEQENLSVIGRIAESILPKSLKDIPKNLKNLPENLKSAMKGELTVSEEGDFVRKGGAPIAQAEITMIEDDLKDFIAIETSAEIDSRMDDTEEILIQNGFPIIGVVGATLVGSTMIQPLSEFIGTDGQIRSLELALSQYNEILAIPSRSIDFGLSPEVAFDKYDRMEAGILALESQLKLSALTSPKVALALKGRGVEARLLKLKEKLQEGRRRVFYKMVQEAFGEVEVSKSAAYLRRLQNERKS